MIFVGATPCLNEEFFLPMYLENVLPQLDALFVVDGGSTDRSLEILCDSMWTRKYSKKLYIGLWPQEGKPYTSDWEEKKRRNFLLDWVGMVYGGEDVYVVNVSVDELLGDNFRERVEELLSEKSLDAVFMPVTHFWGDLQHVRVNCPDGRDQHWYPATNGMGPVIRCDLKIRFVGGALHCYVGGLRPDRIFLCSVGYFHIRYAFGEVKKYGGRPADMYNEQGELCWGEHGAGGAFRGDTIHRVCLKEFKELGLEYPAVVDWRRLLYGDRECSLDKAGGS